MYVTSSGDFGSRNGFSTFDFISLDLSLVRNGQFSMFKNFSFFQFFLLSGCLPIGHSSCTSLSWAKLLFTKLFPEFWPTFLAFQIVLEFHQSGNISSVRGPFRFALFWSFLVIFTRKNQISLFLESSRRPDVRRRFIEMCSGFPPLKFCEEHFCLWSRGPN